VTKTLKNDSITLMDSLKFLQLIGQTIFDKKGTNIFALDLREVSTLTEYFIIAEGGVDRHVKAIADAIVDEAKKHGFPLIMSEGAETGDWCVLDFGMVIVHLFVPHLREYYSLETLWSDGKVVDIPLVI